MATTAGGASEKRPRPSFLLSLALLGHFPNPERDCAKLLVSCPMASWVERASHLASIVSESQGQRGALDLFSNCFSARSVVAPNGVMVRTHPDPDPPLLRGVAYAPVQWASIGSRVHARCVMKWAAMSVSDAEFVFLVDLDAIMLTPQLAQLPRHVADEWHLLMQHMRMRHLRLVSEPDSSSPLNAGFLIFRPDRRVYEAGLRVLRWANTTYNKTHGWELRGRPRDVLPRTDVAWKAAQGTSTFALLRRNDWRFFGAAYDQGFIFYMLRVKFALGEDIPLDPPPGYNRTARWCMPHCADKPYFHLASPGRCRRIRSAAADLRAKAKQYAYLRDGLLDLRTMAYTGDTLFPAAAVERCAFAWEATLNCTDRKAAKANASAWAELRALPIQLAFTNPKCQPKEPYGSLFFRTR